MLSLCVVFCSPPISQAHVSPDLPHIRHMGAQLEDRHPARGVVYRMHKYVNSFVLTPCRPVRPCSLGIFRLRALPLGALKPKHLRPAAARMD